MPATNEVLWLLNSCSIHSCIDGHNIWYNKVMLPGYCKECNELDLHQKAYKAQ